MIGFDPRCFSFIRFNVTVVMFLLKKDMISLTSFSLKEINRSNELTHWLLFKSSQPVFDCMKILPIVFPIKRNSRGEHPAALKFLPPAQKFPLLP